MNQKDDLPVPHANPELGNDDSPDNPERRRVLTGQDRGSGPHAMLEPIHPRNPLPRRSPGPGRQLRILLIRVSLCLRCNVDPE